MGGADHIPLGRLARAAGVDLRKMKVMVFSGSNEAVVAGKEWDKELEKRHIPNEPLDRKRTNEHIAKEFQQIKAILTELGLAKAPAK